MARPGAGVMRDEREGADARSGPAGGFRIAEIPVYGASVHDSTGWAAELIRR